MRYKPLFFVVTCVITGVVTCSIGAAPAARQMTEDRKILHALNRFTFGARPGDPEAVARMGLDRWIELQLHPSGIEENPVLEAKLLPLDSLRMSTAEMLAHYPDRQLIKAMMDGNRELPEDPWTRAAVLLAIAREKAKGDDSAPSATDLPLTAEQKDVLQKGSPGERAALLESLPAAGLAAVLQAARGGGRGGLAGAASPELRRRIEILNAPQQVIGRDLTEGKLLRAVYSNRQLEEVLTDFWYNHFNVFLDKGADRAMVTAYERDVIRPHVLGRFSDLLVATAQSPAMLFYLDNWQSSAPQGAPNPNRKRRQGLNENYGRELMELHTLGVDGGYTQKDVTEVARCFTGWTIRQPQQGGGFFFDARRHDDGAKEVLGVTIPPGGGMEDGMKVLELLARQPATARFVSRSLAVRFVADEPPADLVERMAKAYLATDGDLREVMRAMVKAPAFWDAGNFRGKVKSPLEMVASAVRAVQGDVETAVGLAGLMNQLGEPLYRKQEPTGYSNRGGDWMNSASLLARMNLAGSLAQGKIPGVRVDAAQFAGDAEGIERRILLTEASAASRTAIEAGLGDSGARSGALVAGLTLGSPDFQRR